MVEGSAEVVKLISSNQNVNPSELALTGELTIVPVFFDRNPPEKLLILSINEDVLAEVPVDQVGQNSWRFDQLKYWNQLQVVETYRFSHGRVISTQIATELKKQMTENPDSSPEDIAKGIQ